MKRLISVLILISTLSGCSWLVGDDGYFRDRKNDYLSEKVLPPLEVPETLDQYEEDELFLIPEVNNKDIPDEAFVVPRPAPLLNAGEGNVVRIQKLGDDRWLLIDLPPSQLWQQVKNFLTENKIPIAEENATGGLLATAWLQRLGEDTPKSKERYRYRIDQGVQRNSSEVYVLQNQLPYAAEIGDGLDWPAKSTSVEREEWMGNQLAQFLANLDGAASVSLLAQGIGSASKITMSRDDNGQPLIELNLPFDRAWASIGQALKKADYNVMDLDRSKGLYFVSFQPEIIAEKPGFFARLFGADVPEQVKEDYIFDVVNSEQGVRIQVSDSAQAKLDSSAARALLERLKGFLS